MWKWRHAFTFHLFNASKRQFVECKYSTSTYYNLFNLKLSIFEYINKIPCHYFHMQSFLLTYFQPMKWIRNIKIYIFRKKWKKNDDSYHGTWRIIHINKLSCIPCIYVIYKLRSRSIAYLLFVFFFYIFFVNFSFIFVVRYVCIFSFGFWFGVEMKHYFCIRKFSP